ncbi:MAG: hypothetical protein KGJ79_16005 [Alphaproteobacteria bacterium]|nr:hypothetical protein [Alphaproteobacteria bacterium]MDE2493567.1 hypothetical protein [Alphaproteobacteria bacterium]
MKIETHVCENARRIAVMGGVYGNLPALAACIADANAHQCDIMAFVGDAIGFCGHSDETLSLLRRKCSILIAGNLEQHAAAGSQECGCNYSAAEDERYGCLAHSYAMNSLGVENRNWLATWSDLARLWTKSGTILLCHGSPGQTNEFLFESELVDAKLNGWLNEYGAVGFVCTHSGLPWVHHLKDRRFAVNCGVVGKPDHDGDTAVHYAIIELPFEMNQVFKISIARVEYDHIGWVKQLTAEGVDEIFLTPLRTGEWTCGLASLPPQERRLRRTPDAGITGV